MNIPRSLEQGVQAAASCLPSAASDEQIEEAMSLLRMHLNSRDGELASHAEHWARELRRAYPAHFHAADPRS